MSQVITTPGRLIEAHLLTAMTAKAILAGSAIVLAFMPVMALAQPVAHPVAVFSGLDKITGRITVFDVYVEETVQFGSLQLTPNACYSRSSAEGKSVAAFVQVDEVSLQATMTRVFSGWMFAEAPALNAIDNAVYDLWLIECKDTSDVLPPGQRQDRS